MKKIKRTILLLVVFFGVLCCTYFIINFEVPKKTVSMQKASIPVMYALHDGEKINEMHGYTSKMSAVSMRDTILPVDEKYQASFQIDSYGNEIRALSYELESLDGKQTLSDGKVHLDALGKNSLKADLSFGSRLISNTDYLLVLKLETEEGTDWYYTRIAFYPDASFDACRSFTDTLFQEASGKRKVSLLKTALETESGRQESLQHVTIHSTLREVCWKNFSYSFVTEPVFSVKEVTNSYSSFLLQYRIAHEDNGKTDYYNVREFYRVRCDGGRMYLLDYDRTLSKIFSPETAAGLIYIKLGIRSSNVIYKANDVGNIVCFVQEGELWSFNRDNNVYTKIFAFSSPDDTDSRDLIAEHNIKILRVSEDGSVDYALYGYMNRGDHEGQCGISVCHYDRNTETAEEVLFFPQTTSYYQMEEAAGGLMYLSEKDCFYFASGTSLYRVNLDNKEISVLISSMRKNSWKVSPNGRYVSWTPSSEGKRPHTLQVTDLETEKTSSIRKGNGLCISPLGFMGTDCIYGTAETADLEKADDVFVMNRISIIDCTDKNLKNLKSYHKKGIRYADADISQRGTIKLQCVKWEGDSYADAGSDIVKNRDVLSEKKIDVSYVLPDEGEREVVLTFHENISSGNYTETEAEIAVPLKKTTAKTDKNFFLRDYYVYARGRIVLSASDAAHAVQTADQYGGVVTDDRGNYIWNRARMLSQDKIILHSAGGKTVQAKAVNVMLAAMGTSATDTDRRIEAGVRPYTILKEKEGKGKLLNLSGCSLNEMLYYIGRGYPVYAIKEKGHPVLLTGYTADQIWYFDPADGKVRKMSQQRAEKTFAAGGNIYYAYQRQK